MPSPDRPLTKAQQREAARTERAAQKAAQTKKQQMRRRLLLGMLGTTAVAVGGLGLYNLSHPQGPEKPADKNVLDTLPVLSTTPSSSYSLNRAGNLPLEVAGSVNFDQTYLLSLIEDVNNNQTTDAERRTAVINNLARVRTQSQKGSYSTNALMLDESGIYLTCGHTFIENKFDGTSSPIKPKFSFTPLNLPAQVINPQLMRRYPVIGYLSDPSTEMALFYAPTGFRRKKIPGVNLSYDALAIDQDLWQMALYTNDNRIGLSIMHGKVLGSEADLEPDIDFNIRGRIKVQGMIPFGGSSGSPIIDSSGKVVGVESGLFTKPGTDLSKPVDYQDYAGARIAPLVTLKQSILNSQFIKLPQ